MQNIEQQWNNVVIEKIQGPNNPQLQRRAQGRRKFEENKVVSHRKLADFSQINNERQSYPYP